MGGVSDNRARVARRRAQRLGLQFSQSGTVFRVRDNHGITLALGPLGTVDAYLIERIKPHPPGPAPSVQPPAAWAALLDEYLLTLAAAGQRPTSIRLRRGQLCRMTHELGCPPADTTGATLLRWFGTQQHWTQEARKSYRAAARGFFHWAHRFGHLPSNPADDLPTVRVPKAPPRPASDQAWAAALAAADDRMRLMLRLAGEAGLRRAEVACVHTRDLIEVDDVAQLVVRGKGGKRRVLPLSTSLADVVRLGAAGHTPGMPPRGWIFPNGIGGHLTAGHVGKLVAKALPDDWSMHTLRHRFGTRAYRGSHNLRAVQTLLGHESPLTTERYTAIDDDETRAAAACAW
jgi:integrase